MKKARGILDKHPLNEVRAKKGLPVVNAVLLYGPGSKTTVSSLKEKYKIDVACIAGNGLIKGLCKYLGMTLVPCKGATGTAATDLNAKVEAVISTYKKYDLTFLHVKATDAFGHDKKPVQKKEFIEKFDRALGKLLEKIDLAKTFLFITGDHATPCALGSHSGDPVPIVMAGPTVIRDDVTRFDEASCARGYLSRISGKYVISLILNKLDKLRKFGA
nr:alkaline phosphatase family protein [Candidatus Sigynarchaeota archaeon]